MPGGHAVWVIMWFDSDIVRSGKDRKRFFYARWEWVGGGGGRDRERESGEGDRKRSK